MQTPASSAQCLRVNTPIPGSESKIQTQTFTASVINQVRHHDQGVGGGDGAGTGEVLEDNCPAPSHLRKRWPIARYASGLLRKYEASQLKIISQRNQNGPFKKVSLQSSRTLVSPTSEEVKRRKLESRCEGHTPSLYREALIRKRVS